MVRMNVVLDDDLYTELSTIKNKSEFIRSAIKEKLVAIKEEKIKRALKEGYINEGKNLKDWETTVADGWD